MFSARAIDAAGNVDQSPASYGWTVDTAAPETTIDSGPPSTSTSTSAIFTFASEAGVTYACSLDGGTYEPCTSPATYSGLSEGGHTLAVRATDAAGNTDQSPATRAWTVDLAPETTIHDSPAASTASSTATFTFSSSDPGSSFECALDAGAYSSCASPQTYSTLGAGPHEFKVRATDSVGNVDPTVASYSWTITPPPETTILTQPDEQTESTTATFTFESNQGNATFRCALDTAEPEPCTSGVTYTNLTPGSHDFLVEAVGPEGNADPSPAEFGWEIGDLTPPVVTITATPDATTERTTPSRFEFSVDDPEAALQCSLDGGPLQVCTSPKEYSNLPAGEHIFEVTAVKQDLLVEVTPVEHPWTVVDTSAPETAIDSGPAAEIALDTLATFSFSSTETDATFECSLNGEAFGDCPVPSVFDLNAGVYTLQVRAVDPSGNTDATPASYSFAVLGEPTTTISSAPTDPANDTAATFVFAADQSGATYVCSLDGAPFTACTSPKTYTDLTYAEHTFAVQATSRFGFVEAAPVTHTWTIEVPPDTAAPETTIDSGPAASTGSSVATFRFSGTDNVTPAAQLTFECSLDGGAFEPCTSPHALPNVTVGAHTLAVQAVDLLGNVDATPATHSWTVVAPETTIVSGPPATTATATATFQISSDDPNATFECSLDGGATWSGCDSPHAVENLVPGAYELSVRAVNADGTADPTPAAYNWTVVAPDTSITSSPPASSLNTTADFRFASTDLAAGFECALDGNAFGDCDSHYVLQGMTVGTHTLLVRAVSTAGTVDATPASHTWTVEGPSATIVSGPPASTHNVNALFTFESNDPLATFECALDGATYGSCETPYQLTGVAAGAHELSVRAVNSVGGVGTPATHAWTIQAPPDTTLLTFPTDPTEETTATFTFDSDQDGVTFECALDEAVDDQVFTPCSSPHTYNDLIFGEHEFAVRAIDAQGNFDPTPAEYLWQVGGPAPPVAIDAAPDARTDSRSATFEFSADGRSLRFECALDAGAFTLCDSPKTYNNLTLAPHTFQVRVYAPEAPAEPQITTYSWSVVELDPPETTILLGPPSPSDSTTASFAFQSDEAGATFQCSLDGAPYSACPVPSDFTGLSNGSHTLLVRAVDAYENVDPTPSSYTWTVAADVEPPVTQIISGPDATTTLVDAAFSFTSEPGATFECSLDGAAFADCSSPQEFSDLALGTHTFRVRATDLTGNVESPVSYVWTIEPDTTPPDTTLHSAPPASTDVTDATFTFSSNELNAEFECSLDGETFGGCETPDIYTDLAIGSHTYAVRAVDLAGNVDPTPATHTWTITTPPDTTDPETTIMTGPGATTIDVVATFNFFSSEPESTFECALDAEPFAECDPPAEYSDLAPGSHTFRVRATDLTGNVDETPATYAWTVVAAPETTITEAPAATAASASATFKFSSDQTGVTYFCSLDGLDATVCSSPKTYTGLPDGEHTFTVTARNSLGAVDETPAEHVWTVAVPPETSITTKPENPTTATSATFTFTGTDVDPTFECSLDGAAFAECDTPALYSGLSTGQHTFEVRAIDAEGNVDPTPATFTWTVSDGTAPQTTIGAGAPAANTNNVNATFNFTADEAGSSFACSIDDGPYFPCTSPKTYTNLAAGPHVVRVRATDTAGNTDQSPATHSWTIDTAAPETTIGSGAPPATTTSTSATFNFSGSEQGSTFECSLDGAAFAACTSPRAYTGLAFGPHEFRVRAIDAVGNADGSPATHSWTVEPSCPTGTFTGSIAEDSWVDQSSPDTNKGADSILKVQSKGPANNVRSLVRFNNPAIPAGCAVKTATLRLYESSYREGRTIQALRVDGGWNEGTVSWNNQPSTAGTPGSAPSRTSAGYLEIDVRWQLQAIYDSGANNGFQIRDASENQDAEQQFHSREKGSEPPQLVVTFGAPDNTPPETTITGGPSAETLSRSASIAFSASQEFSTFECSVDGGAFTACTSPKQLNGLALGDHDVRVRAIDAAGNVDPTPAQHTWRVLPDTTAPETTLGSGTPSSPTTSKTATFTFSGTDNVDSGAQLTFECSLDGGAFQSCASPKDYTDLAVGTHGFRVRAVDQAGNADQSPASYTWTIQAPPQGCTAAPVTASADRDTWVLQSSPTSTFGTDSVLKVDSKSGGNARAMVRFNLPTIPAGCQITGAMLRLYSGSYKEGRTLQAVRLNGSGPVWVENSVTWNTQPAPATGVTPALAQSRNSPGWVEWNVAAQMTGVYGNNKGFLIRDASENGGGMEQGFHSREKGTDNPPQLVITFG
jgi:large repetitive protein